MADGSIRIETVIETKAAKARLKELEKLLVETKNKQEKLNSSDEMAMLREEMAIEKQRYEEALKRANSQQQINNLEREHDAIVEQIGIRHQTLVDKANQYSKTIADAEREASALQQSLTQNNSQSVQTETHASRLKTFFSGAKNAALGIAKTMGGAALTGIKKVGNGLKNAVSHIKNMGKQADGLRKKFLKIGLALVGIRGLMAGMRQMVSSALQNNEKLQNQLTAIKGVLGQALAPAISIVTNALGQIVTFVDKLYQMLTGISLVAKYNTSQAEKAAKATADAAKSAKEYKNQMAGFDVANKLEDNSSSASSSSSSDSDTAIFETQELSSWAQELISKIKSSWQNADFTDVGNMISSKIVSILKGINWDDIKKKSFKGGKSFATLINGLMEYSDEDGNTLATSIGSTLAESLNTALNFASGFAKNLKWGKVGKNAAEGLLSGISTFDWKLAGETIHDFVVGFCDSIAKFFDRLSKNDEGYKTIKKALTDFFNGLEIGEIVLSILKAILSIANFSFKFIGNLGEDILKSIFGWFGIEWDGEYIQLSGPLGIAVPKIEWKKSSNKDKDETKKSFWERVWEILGSVSPITMSLGSSNGSGFNVPVTANFTQTVNDIKTAWENRKAKITDKTATFKAKFTQKISDIKASWSSRKAKITDKTATFTAKFSQTASDIKKAWQDRTDKIKNKTFEITAKFKDAVTSAINSLIGRLNTVISKLRSFKVAGVQPFKNINDIPKLAKGGIVNNPGRGVHAIVGEAGPEAVLPLTDAVLGKIASMISEKITINQPPIQLTNNNYLDGKLIEKRVSQIQSQKAFMTNKGGAY